MFSVAHERERRPRTRVHRTQDVTTPTNTHKGWRFATDSPWTLWHTGGSRQGHPRYTRASKEEGCGWPDASSTRRPTTNDNPTDKVSRQTCVQQPGVDTLGNLHGSGAARRSHGDRAVRRLVRSRLVNRIEVETSRIIKKIAQRETKPITQEKINQETEYIKIPAESVH